MVGPTLGNSMKYLPLINDGLYLSYRLITGCWNAVQESYEEDYYRVSYEDQAPSQIKYHVID